jgi:hypothetical protein
MKLLNCLECHDIRKIHTQVKYCDCGKSSAQYLADGNTVVYKGNARILGIGNPEYALSLEQWRFPHPKTNFRWYVFRDGTNVRKYGD